MYEIELYLNIYIPILYVSLLQDEGIDDIWDVNNCIAACYYVAYLY